MATPLNFAIRATNDASATLKAVGGDLDDLGKKADDVDGKFKRAGNALGDMGKIAGGFVIGAGLTALPGLLGSMVSAAVDDAAATERLGQSIRNLGGDYDSIMGKVNAAITSGQKLAFTDDDVRDSFQSLAVATGDADEALRRQKIAMDLARGANIPLAMATKMLGKVNEENVDSFRRLGIEIADGATEAEALAAVQEKFAGQSKIYAESTKGQFAQAKIAFGELAETGGAVLLPMITAIGQKLLENLPHIQAFAEKAADYLTNTFIPAAGQLLDWVKEKWPQISAVFATTGDLIKNAIENVQTIIGVIQPIVEGIISFVQENWPKVAAAFDTSKEVFLAVSGAVQSIYDTVSTVIGAVVSFVQTNWPLVEAVFSAFSGFVTGTLIPAVQSIYDTVSSVVEQVVSFVQSNWPLVEAVFSAFSEFLTGTLFPIVQKIYDTVSSVVSSVVSFVQTNWPLVEAVFSAFIGWITDTFWPGVKKIYEVVKGAVDDAVDFVTENWTKVTDRLGDIVNWVRDTFGPGMAKLTGFITGPIDAAVTGVAFAVGKIKGLLQGIIDKVNDVNHAIDNMRSVPGGGFIGGVIDRAIGTAGRAGGGRVNEAMTLVGEQGPELVSLPVGSYVHTAQQTARMLGIPGFAGGGYVETIPERVARRIAEIQEAERRQAAVTASQQSVLGKANWDRFSHYFDTQGRYRMGVGPDDIRYADIYAGVDAYGTGETQEAKFNIANFDWRSRYSTRSYDSYGNMIGALVASYDSENWPSRRMQTYGVQTLGPSGTPESGYWFEGRWNPFGSHVSSSQQGPFAHLWQGQEDPWDTRIAVSDFMGRLSGQPARGGHGPRPGSGPPPGSGGPPSPPRFVPGLGWRGSVGSNGGNEAWSPGTPGPTIIINSPITDMASLREVAPYLTGEQARARETSWLPFEVAT